MFSYTNGFIVKSGIRILLTFLDNILVYLFNKTPSRGPCYVNMAISEDCNFRCAYCNKWQKNNVQEKICLTPEERLEVISQLAKSGVCYLSLYDKEPLLAEDLNDIITEAKEGGMLVNISTNGFLLKEKAKSFIKLEVDSVIISVESHIPEVHDRIRGYDGSFSRILLGIDEIMQNRKSKKRPSISIRTLINKETFGDLDKYVDFWKDRVDNIILKPIGENPLIDYSLPDNMRFSARDQPKFEEFFYNLLKKYPKLDNVYNRLIPEYFFRPQELRKRYNCFAGFIFGNIDLEGNVYFCAEHKHKIGNLREKDFLEIWSSLFAKYERKSIVEQKECFCWLEFFLFNIYLTNLLGKKR